MLLGLTYFNLAKPPEQRTIRLKRAVALASSPLFCRLP